MTESVTEKEPHTQLFNNLKSLVQYQYTTMPYNNGFIIVRYIESSEINQDASFEELKPEIEQAIIKEKRKDIYKNLIQDIKSESNIVISL
jgi:macrodomain Ter protein organizer (MatP/YcbG family)